MNGIPTVLRLWLMGTACGVACGIVAAWAIALVLAVSAGGPVDSLGDLLVDVAVVLILGGIYGGTIGFFLGCPTGLFAGVVMTVMLRLVEPVKAAWNTVITVLAGQLLAEIAFYGLPGAGGVWWYLVVPAITVIPLTLVIRAAARDASAPATRHRDTLAA